MRGICEHSALLDDALAGCEVAPDEYRLLVLLAFHFRFMDPAIAPLQFTLEKPH